MTFVNVAELVRSHDLPDRRRLVATFAVSKLRGHPQPAHFSATAERLNLRRQGDNRFEALGCLHDDITAAWPDARPFVALHLSDLNGRPMHATENGRYWLGFCKQSDGRPMTPDDDYGRRRIATDSRGTWAPYVAAEHFRVTADEVEELRRRALDSGLTSVTGFAELVELYGFPARWRAEADAALAWLGVDRAEVLARCAELTASAS